MRFPGEWSQMEQTLAQHLPHLRPAQRRSLALWVYGTILAQSACQNAVVTALLAVGAWHALRQRLREWLYDGPEKAAPCQTQLDVALCFAPLLRWLLAWWQGQNLALAIDATAHGECVVVLVVSVLYRGSAMPVAWHVLPANQAGAWMPHILRLLRQLRPVVPRRMQVLVLADRGLWSPRLWKRIRDLRWHPVLRVQETVSFQPLGQRRRPARQLVPGPGHAWVGRGVAFKHRVVRRVATLVVVWAAEQTGPWMVLTDMPPERVGICWYGLRVWIELGFRALKGVGWQWQQTRRTQPVRVARHWLVLAVAMLWVLAYGSRVEDAEVRGLPPGRLRTPPPCPPCTWRAACGQRLVSVFRLGLSWLRTTLRRGYLWRRLWLIPAPWPQPLPQLQITYQTVAEMLSRHQYLPL
jgi:Transposase DDE domain